MRVSLAGNPDAHGHLLITTADGRRLGYLNGRLVNEIKGARIYQPLLSRVWKAQPEPIYQLPAGSPVTVTLGGAGANGSDPATIHLTGPGFGATITNLRPLAGTFARVTVLPGGSKLSLQTGGARSGQSPTIELATDHGRGGTALTATPAALASPGMISLALDPAAGRVSVARAGAGGLAPVSLRLEQVGANASRVAEAPVVRLGPSRRATFSLHLGRIG